MASSDRLFHPLVLTLEAELVPLERSNGLPEKLLGMLISCLHSRDIHLLPFDGDIVRLEDLLDRLGNFGTNTVTWLTC